MRACSFTEINDMPPIKYMSKIIFVVTPYKFNLYSICIMHSCEVTKTA